MSIKQPTRLKDGSVEGATDISTTKDITTTETSDSTKAVSHEVNYYDAAGVPDVPTDPNNLSLYNNGNQLWTVDSAGVRVPISGSGSTVPTISQRKRLETTVGVGVAVRIPDLDFTALTIGQTYRLTVNYALRDGSLGTSLHVYRGSHPTIGTLDEKFLLSVSNCKNTTNNSFRTNIVDFLAVDQEITVWYQGTSSAELLGYWQLGGTGVTAEFSTSGGTIGADIGTSITIEEISTVLPNPLWG